MNEHPPYLTENNLAKDKYKAPDTYLENPHAIVIGSGIGGMGIASILAQKKKWKVLLLEGNSVPGGCTHNKELGGFEWPTGIDSIGDMDPSVGRGLYRPSIDYITGGKLQWEKMPDVHEVVQFENDRYEWHSSHDKNIAWIEEMFAKEGKKVNVKNYYKLEQKIEWWAWSWAVTKLLPECIPISIRELFYKIFGGKWRKYMNRSITDVFCKELGFPEKLAAIFSYMYGNHGATPANAPFAFHAVNLHHYLHGAYYPIGGSGQIAECVIPIIENTGGQVAVQSLVKKIIVEDNTAKGVELANGKQIFSPLIISDASAYTTFMELLDRDIAERHGYAERFNKIGPSVAHLYLFLGYNEEIELPKHIIWHLPSYDIETTDKQYKEQMDFNCMGCYLLCPSARDPIFSKRYPNKSEVIVLAESPYAWIKKGRQDSSFKKKFEDDLTAHLEKVVFHHMPQLKDKTPTFRQAGATMGCNPWAWEACSLGLEPSRDRFVSHTHWLRPKTKIKGLYLTGQDCFSMGFAGAMLASRLCYSAITGNWWFMLKKKIKSKI
jgi:all-trans-retinol 13,14-reductase